MNNSVDNPASLESGSNNSGMFFNPQQLVVSDADSQLLAENANAGFDIANEIKRWQQMHQSNNNGTTSTALLSNTGTNFQQELSTTAFLQQMIDSQQQQQQHQQRGTSNRFDIPLANSLTLTGQIGGNPATTEFNNGSNDLLLADPNSNNNSGTTNQLPVGLNLSSMAGPFYTDPRLFMAQQAVAAMNFTSFSNPGMFQQQPPQQEPPQQPIFPQLSSLQQQQQQLDATNHSLEGLPLPSPHSLFHRDGTRRMRGGVIEPFPVRTFQSMYVNCDILRALMSH